MIDENDTRGGVTTWAVVGIVIWVVLMMGITGALSSVGLGDDMTGEERHVEVKVAAFPGNADANMSQANIDQYEELNRHEQRLFMKAVEESDASVWESAQFSMSADENVSIYDDTDGVRYAGTVYPVFVVENEIRQTTDWWVYIIMGVVGLIAAILAGVIDDIIWGI